MGLADRSVDNFALALVIVGFSKIRRALFFQYVPLQRTRDAVLNEAASDARAAFAVTPDLGEFVNMREVDRPKANGKGLVAGHEHERSCESFESRLTLDLMVVTEHTETHPLNRCECSAVGTKEEGRPKPPLVIDLKVARSGGFEPPLYGLAARRCVLRWSVLNGPTPVTFQSSSDRSTHYYEPRPVTAQDRESSCV